MTFLTPVVFTTGLDPGCLGVVELPQAHAA